MYEYLLERSTHTKQVDQKSKENDEKFLGMLGVLSTHFYVYDHSPN